MTLTSVEMESLVGRIVRYMLFSSYEKPGVPVPRTKLSELVLSDNKNHKHSKHLLAKTLPEAQVGISVGRGHCLGTCLNCRTLADLVPFACLFGILFV